MNDFDFIDDSRLNVQLGKKMFMEKKNPQS